MREKFIKFTETTSQGVIEHYINPIFISSFSVHDNKVCIVTMEKTIFNVDQTADEVIKELKDSEKITFYNKINL